MLGRYLQYLSIFVIVAGITVEVTLRAHLGYILITTGSLMFGIGTKIHYYKKIRRGRR